MQAARSGRLGRTPAGGGEGAAGADGGDEKPPAAKAPISAVFGWEIAKTTSRAAASASASGTEE